MLKRWYLGLIGLLALGAIALAQTTSFPPPAGTQVILCTYQSTTQTLSSSGAPAFLLCDSGARLSINIGAVNGSATSGGTVPTASLATSSIIGAVSYSAVQSLVGAPVGVLIAATPGNLYADKVCNSSTVGLYLKLYDVTTVPAVGTTTPIANLLIPASGCRPALEGPISFVNGIAYGLSSSKTLMGAAQVGADDVTGLILYKAQ